MSMMFLKTIVSILVLLFAIVGCEAKRCYPPKCSRKGDCFRRVQRCCRGTIFKSRCRTDVGRTCFTRRVLGVCTGREASPVQGCIGKSPGYTFNCNCYTTRTKDGTPVHSQCADARTVSGKDRPKLYKGVGLAVYSPHHKLICGAVTGSARNRCKCSCFTKADIDGPLAYKTSSSTRSGPGKGTACLGLCGAHCKAGRGNRRYASILIHDICQSYIHSSAPYPFPNNCVDEGSHAISAAALERVKDECPAS